MIPSFEKTFSPNSIMYRLIQVFFVILNFPKPTRAKMTIYKRFGARKQAEYLFYFFYTQNELSIN